MISVVVPLYNEEKALPALLDQLDRLVQVADCPPLEVLFSDGGSTDRTRDLLKGRTVVTGAKGRGAQCNRGAEAAAGEVFFFLHCDSVLDASALTCIQSAVRQGTEWGCLHLRFDHSGLVYRLGSAIADLRVRWGHIAFGDQGIFMTRALFQRVGGFPDLPLMEDYELSLRLKKLDIPPVRVRSGITTSARRFEAGGPLRVGLKMQRLKAMYRRGADMQTIIEAYRDVRAP